MKTNIIGIATKAAEVLASGEVINHIVNQAATRTKDVADILEEIDKSIKEKENA